MRTPSHRTARLTALAVPLLLAGCGGQRTVIVDASVLRVRLDEYRITPQQVQVRAGRLKLIAVNTGVISHNVKVELGHRDALGQPIVLGGTATAQPGQEVVAKLNLRPGRYLLADTLGNHVDLGQYGTLIVK